MPMHTLIAFLAGGLMAIWGFSYALSKPSPLRFAGWIFPALLSLAFFGFSLYAILIEGSTGFWVDHTRNAWGNQIWMDLLLAVALGWFLIVPRARSLGMRLMPWFIFVLATGSIGFMAMLARLLYLEQGPYESAEYE